MTKPEKGTPILVITRSKFDPKNKRDYLEVAEQTCQALKASEAGLIYQTCSEDPSNHEELIWSELFLNEKALNFHLENPPFCLFLANHQLLGCEYTVEIHGEINDESIAILNKKKLKFIILNNKTYFNKIE
tara:strand:- start:3308 stop:3700 length:393 start_codon:yes stop_codon:yes gene_type:complete